VVAVSADEDLLGGDNQVDEDADSSVVPVEEDHCKEDHPRMPLLVIGAGFGRTGTLSLKAAFEQLGFDPCYHMAEVIVERPGLSEGHVDVWRDFICEGRPMDWQRLFAGYQACLDFPACVYYREVMAAFPAAPVVLSVRDPAAWAESWGVLRATRQEIQRVTQSDPRMRRWGEFVEKLEERWLGSDTGHAAAIEAFERHNAEVKAVVPRGRSTPATALHMRG